MTMLVLIFISSDY